VQLINAITATTTLFIIQVDLLKPVQKTKAGKFISEPLRLVDTSDEEYLVGRPSRNKGGMVSDKHD
jgi:hypothetical protein